VSRLGNILNAIISTKTGTITPSSGFTFGEVNVKERNGVVIVSGYLYRTNGNAFGTTEVMVGTVSGVTMPSQIVRIHTGSGNWHYSPFNNAYAALNTAGEIRVTCQNNTDKRVVFDFEYIVGT